MRRVESHQPGSGVIAPTDQSESHYDRMTIALHWLTAGLVIVLFLLAESWGFFPREIRKAGQALHISLGILLGVVLATRLVWRGTGSRRLPPASVGLLHWAAKSAHLALYALLVAQVALGFLFRWAQAEPFLFFGMFSIPSPIVFESGMDRTFGELHNIVAWTIIVLAGLHAAAALVHHHVLRDGVLRRMLPGRA